MIIDKREKNCKIVYVAIVERTWVRARKDAKVVKYQNLVREVWSMWGVSYTGGGGSFGNSTTKVERQSESCESRHQ